MDTNKTMVTSPELSLFLPVLDEEDNLRPMHEKIGTALDALGKSAEVIYVDDGSTDRSLEILKEIASLNDKITVVEKNFVLDTEDKAKYKVDKAPAIVILSDGIDTRMRMYGAPTGYEFVGLVEAIMIAGTAKIELDPETMKWIQAVDKPTHIQVFSTPT